MSTTLPRIPDSQTVMLDALNKCIEDTHSALLDMGIDAEEIQYCYPDEAYESVVFTGEDLFDSFGNDIEEGIEVFMMVGARDLDCKIREARATLAAMNNLIREDEDYD